MLGSRQYCESVMLLAVVGACALDGGRVAVELNRWLVGVVAVGPRRAALVIGGRRNDQLDVGRYLAERRPLTSLDSPTAHHDLIAEAN